MKFSVSSTKLFAQLQIVSRVIASKSTMAILDTVLFQLEGNKLTLTASDAETRLVTTLEVDDVEGEGTVAIAAKWLLDMLREFSEQPLSFDINNENFAVSLKSANGAYSSVGQNGDIYPQMSPLENDAQSFAIGSDVLLAGISQTLFCTADDELRPVMNGIFMDFGTDNVTMVATDAHKLVRYINGSVKSEQPAGVILPKKPANMLKGILPKESGDVQVQFDTKNICFTLENYTMISRQVEGKFPNYNAVIPKDNTRKVIVDRMALMSAIKRVSVNANAASNLVKLHFGENTLEVSAQDIDFSIAGMETLSCQYADEPLNIGFKSTFLIEILNTITSNEVILELGEPSRAGLVLPFENGENEDLLMLLMPMLLNE